MIGPGIGLRDDPLALALVLFALATCSSLVVFATAPARGLAPELELPARRVISLMPALTETVAAVGAGDCLIAVSDYCAHPAAVVDGLPRVGGEFNPNLERILELAPDLVLIPEGVTGMHLRLAAVGIPSRRFETRSFATIESSFRVIGRLTGHQAEGDALAVALRRRLAELAVRGRARGTSPRVLVMVNHLPGDLAEMWVAGQGTFLGEILEVLGAHNVITSSGYESIGREALLQLDPEIVIDLFAPGTTTPPPESTVLALWRSLPTLAAVRSGRVHYRTSNAYVAPGPRLVTEGILDDFAHMLEEPAW